MEKLLQLLKDGRTRSTEIIAAELGTSTEDVLRKIEFLERSGIIRRVATSFPKTETLRTAGKNSAAGPSCSGGCKSCSGCSHGCGTKACSACMPEGGFKNMGIMWEIIEQKQ
ncbi:MAG: Lrp/AsnC family transcriptional regulator [Spirochaetaceae bacterium]|nr:Lrp/AsnC family transcriptional regulator [Spirochaetaceae bacterium]